MKRIKPQATVNGHSRGQPRPVKSRLPLLLILSLMLTIGSIPARGEFKSGEDIGWQVISGGGTEGSTTSYGLRGTMGQTAIDHGQSDTLGLAHGYWSMFSRFGGTCCDLPGDANNDGVVNILDITFLINYLYKLGPAPDCPVEGDTNGDCVINILDVTYLINYLYKGGPLPICGDCPNLEP